MEANVFLQGNANGIFDIVREYKLQKLQDNLICSLYHDYFGTRFHN